MFRTALCALFATLISTSGYSASITQNLTLEGNDEHDQNINDPYFYDGNLFDPTLGTLNSVNAVFTGSLESVRFFESDGGNFYKTAAVATTSYMVFGYATSLATPLNGTVISQVVNPYYPDLPDDSALYSLSEQVSIPVALPAAPDLTGNSSSPLSINHLLAIRFGTVVGSYVGVGYDLEDFNGTASLTYNYTPVPEPGTVGLLGLGVAALVALRRNGRTFATACKDPLS